MSETIVVAILSLVGTAIGSISAVFAANTLTNYKIEELRKTVEKHNSLIDRTYRLEERATLTDEKLETLEHRVTGLERK